MTQPTADTRRSGYPTWVVIAAAVAAVIFAVLVISRVAAPLAGLLAPPSPPFYEPATLLEHTPVGNGSGEWLYASDAAGCEIYDWYQAQGGACTLSPGSQCNDASVIPSFEGPYSVGYCRGQMTFGSFALDWDIFIHDGYNDADGRTRFLITGEVDWINQN